MSKTKELTKEIERLVESETAIVSFAGDEVAKHAEIALKAIAVVLDIIDDQEAIDKLDEASDILRNMVPHLQ